MNQLNLKQVESIKEEIEIKFPVQGLTFNSTFHNEEKGIKFAVLERYSQNMKIIYVIVPLEKSQQFDRLNDLEIIARNLCEKRDVNFGFFGTCTFHGDTAIDLQPNEDHQIERLN